MKQIFFIMSIILKNKMKDYFFVTSLVSSIVFGIILFLSSKLFIGEKYKIFMDLGIAGINLITFFTSVFFSSEIFPELRKSKFYHWMLALPVAKSQIFMGVFLSTAFMILFILCVYTATYLLFFPFFNLSLNLTMLFYFLISYMKFLLLGAIGIVISIQYNTFSVILIQLGIYLIGSSLFDFIMFLSKKGMNELIFAAKVLYYIFPDYNIEHFTAKVTHFKPIDSHILVATSLYYLTYVIIVLVIGILLTEHKDII